MSTLNKENLENMVQGAWTLANKTVTSTAGGAGYVAAALVNQALERGDQDLFEVLQEFAPKKP